MRKDASEAAAAFGAKMRAKLAKLEIPLADRREEDERQVCRVRVRDRLGLGLGLGLTLTLTLTLTQPSPSQTLLEQQKQKLASWATSEEAIAKAVADPKGSVKVVCAAAAEPLSEALDAELGALTRTLTLTLTLSQA